MYNSVSGQPRRGGRACRIILLRLGLWKRSVSVRRVSDSHLGRTWWLLLKPVRRGLNIVNNRDAAMFGVQVLGRRPGGNFIYLFFKNQVCGLIVSVFFIMFTMQDCLLVFFLVRSSKL